MFLLSLLLLACPKKPSETSVTQAPELSALQALVEIHGDRREYVGPARAELLSEDPLLLVLEDFAQADPTQILVESRQPVQFGRPGGAPHQDRGSFVAFADHDLFSIERVWEDGDREEIVVVLRKNNEPIAVPKSWLAPGTVLYYGLSFPDKPITQVIPLGLMITVLPTDNQDLRFAWQMEVDPDAEIEDPSKRMRRGERTIPAAVRQSAREHSDVFVAGNDTVASTSLFLSQDVYDDLPEGARWQDSETLGHTLKYKGSGSYITQADDRLWEIPTRRAELGSTKLVIAADPEFPLILSADRKRYSMKLLAIGVAR